MAFTTGDSEAASARSSGVPRVLYTDAGTVEQAYEADTAMLLGVGDGAGRAVYISAEMAPWHSCEHGPLVTFRSDVDRAASESCMGAVVCVKACLPPLLEVLNTQQVRTLFYYLCIDLSCPHVLLFVIRLG